MTTPAFDIYHPAIFEVPVPPDEFGQDGGKFYRCYDALAEEIDDDTVNGLKEQLDGLLIFAGLFAGVNSAFLALTLPLMSPDPADDTNALLRENNALLLQLVLGRNDSIPITNALPSETFSPTGKVLTVNVLFSVSLTLALISSFMAVLGRQWLVYYRKRTGGGPDSQRWEQLKRFLGAERWGLEWALDDFLPSILQIGLITFCISLTIYLKILHPTLSNVVGAFMWAGLAVIIITALLAIWDKFCPFQSPLSHLISQSAGQIPRGLRMLFRLVCICLIWPIATTAKFLIMLTALLWRRIRSRCCSIRQPKFDCPGEDIDISLKIFDSLPQLDAASLLRLASQVRKGKRKEEDLSELQIHTIRRVICTSDDALNQLHGVSNILAINDSRLLHTLALDDEFTTRLYELQRSSYSRILQLRGRGQLELASMVECFYDAALAHVILSAGVLEEGLFGLMASRGPRLFPPSDLLQNSHPNVINAYLGCVAFNIIASPRVLLKAELLPPSSSIDVLFDPTWKRISIVLQIVLGTWVRFHFRGSQDLMGKLYRACVGDPNGALNDLELAMKESSSRSTDEGRAILMGDDRSMDEDSNILKKYLVAIFKFAGKAAVDRANTPNTQIDVVAQLLRLSEMFIRTEDSPSDFIDIGRGIRRDLLGVLASAHERNKSYFTNDPWPNTLCQLNSLFSDLTAPFKSPTISSNEDDLDLLSLFSPILLHLQAVTRDPRRGILRGEDGVSQVNRLDGLFRDFKTAVETVSRKLKRRDRDPELGIWCHWQDENTDALGY